MKINSIVFSGYQKNDLSAPKINRGSFLAKDFSFNPPPASYNNFNLAFQANPSKGFGLTDNSKEQLIAMKKIVATFIGECPICAKKIHHYKELHGDHINPHATGGSDVINENCIIICSDCDIAKFDKSMDTFLKGRINGGKEAIRERMENYLNVMAQHDQKGYVNSIKNLFQRLGLINPPSK